MYWLFVVLGGHLSNAGAFVIDKVLLQKTMKYPSVYVFYIGVLGLLAFILLPFSRFSLMPNYLMLQAAVSGVTFMVALLGFFTVLQREEATRVIPFFGGLIPVWTLAFAAVFLGERLSSHEWWGVILLIVGAVLISYEPDGGSGTMSWRLAALIALSAGCFALSSTLLKAVFNGTSFLNGFLWTRLFASLAVLPLLLLPATRGAVVGRGESGASLPSALLFIGQTLGALGFVLLAWGTNLAPRVTIVNALQGVQYALLFIFVVLLHAWRPGLIPEHLSPAIVTQKVSALALLSIGLVLVA